MIGFMLAAGFGTRLWPLSEVRAKPAFPFRGVPLIVHTAQLMARHGVHELFANTHHLPESIRKALGDVPARLVHEQEILGTAGALVNLAKELRRDRVLVMNAKVVTDIDLSRVIARAQAPVTMVCVPNAKREKFTDVEFAADGTLTVFSQVLGAHPHIFTGIQVLDPDFFNYLPSPGFSDTIKDVYPRILDAGKHIHVEVSHDAWAEFSTLARYRDLHVGGFVDASAQVASDAMTTSAVIWENTCVGTGADVSGSIVADGVVIPAGFVARNCAIIQAERISDRKDARIEHGLLLTPI